MNVMSSIEMTLTLEDPTAHSFSLLDPILLLSAWWYWGERWRWLQEAKARINWWKKWRPGEIFLQGPIIPALPVRSGSRVTCRAANDGRGTAFSCRTVRRGFINELHLMCVYIHLLFLGVHQCVIRKLHCSTLQSRPCGVKSSCHLVSATAHHTHTSTDTLPSTNTESCQKKQHL